MLLILLTQIGCILESREFAKLESQESIKPNDSITGLKSDDPCLKISSEPSRAIQNHLSGLTKKEAAQHFFASIVSLSGHHIKVSKQIRYLKWFVNSLNFLDKIELAQHDNHVNRFLHLIYQMSQEDIHRMKHGGYSASVQGISFNEFKNAINALNAIDNRNKVEQENREDASTFSLANNVVPKFMAMMIWGLMVGDAKTVEEFSLYFSKWSKEAWFRKHFLEVIKLIKKSSSDLRFIKEKFVSLEKRIKDTEKIELDFYRKKIINQFFHMGDSLSLLYNNDGFESGKIKFKDGNKILGRKIEVQGIKTGYNIYFPDKLSRDSAFIVFVYGGYGRELKNQDFLPGQPNAFNYGLLANNNVVAELNLPDRLELDSFQMEMSEEIHRTIHASINNFFDVVAHDPESLIVSSALINSKLSAKIRALKNMPKYIFGVSFGGRTAVRHIQLYPDTFDGAMSFGGGLMALSNRPYLWPINYVDDLKQRVLVVHSLDDGRVKVGDSVAFTDKALARAKDIQMHLIKRGNPIILDNGTQGLSLKGHGHPTREDYFYDYAQRLNDFVAHRPVSYKMRAKQKSVLNKLQSNRYFKTNYNSVWYILKEAVFYRVKDIDKRHEMRRIIHDLSTGNMP